MGRTSTAKQQKCIVTARRYRGACRYFSRQGPDVVDMSVCTWRNIAIPAILFGTEMIPFSKTTLDALDREQAKWAKQSLGLHQTCSNTAPQILMGAPSFKELIFQQQLKYFMRLQELPETRYAAQALIEHETGGWRSPYLHHMAKIQEELGIVQLPPSAEFIDEIVSSHCLAELQIKVASLSSISIDPGSITCLERMRSAREGEAFNWINRAIMGCTGIQFDGITWRKLCPEDGRKSTDLHFVSECMGTARARKETGLNSFFTSCDLIGIGKKDAYSNFLRGLSASGEFIKMEDYVERGRSLGAIFKTDLRN